MYNAQELFAFFLLTFNDYISIYLECGEEKKERKERKTYCVVAEK